MKYITFTLFILAISLASLANPTNKAIVNNGKWKDASSWSLGRVPQGKDTILIPKGITLFVDNNVKISPESVYLRIGGTLELTVGKLDLGSGSIIEILSGGSISSYQNNNSDKIEIGGVVKYTGTEGTVAGPAYASSSTTSSPSGFKSTTTTVLPVKFAGFVVTLVNNNAVINWATAEEVNANLFEVEKSIDGKNWSTIAYVSAAGNATTINNYSYTDKNVSAPVTYYRIKQVDFNNSATYTTTKSVKAETVAAAEVKISSLSDKKVLISLAEPVNGSLVVRLTATNGQVIAQQVYTNPSSRIIYSNNAVTGSYILTISNGKNVNVSKQVIL